MIFCDLGECIDEGEIYAHFRVSIASAVIARAMRHVQEVRKGLCSRRRLATPELVAKGRDCPKRTYSEATYGRGMGVEKKSIRKLNEIVFTMSLGLTRYRSCYPVQDLLICANDYLDCHCCSSFLMYDLCFLSLARWEEQLFIPFHGISLPLSHLPCRRQQIKRPLRVVLVIPTVDSVDVEGYNFVGSKFKTFGAGPLNSMLNPSPSIAIASTPKPSTIMTTTTRISSKEF